MYQIIISILFQLLYYSRIKCIYMYKYFIHKNTFRQVIYNWFGLYSKLVQYWSCFNEWYSIYTKDLAFLILNYQNICLTSHIQQIHCAHRTWNKVCAAPGLNLLSQKLVWLSPGCSFVELSHFSLKMMFCAINATAPKTKKKRREKKKKRRRPE